MWFKDEKLFSIYNGIDDTDQNLTEEELKTESNINMALTKGVLYQY